MMYPEVFVDSTTDWSSSDSDDSDLDEVRNDDDMEAFDKKRSLVHQKSRGMPQGH
jgi:hypothetical protein